MPLMLEKMLRGIVLAGAFALPFIVLIVATSMFFPYITGKNFAFRIIVEIMTGAWLALALISEKYRPRRSWVWGAVALFVFIMAIANAQGAYPFKSFWSNYERMDGWVTLIHVLMYFTVISSVIAKERIWKLLFQTSLGVSVFVSIYGFLQMGGVVMLGGGTHATSLANRIDATFGNPIYLAVYMLFNIFIAALLWWQMWQANHKGKRMWPSILYGTVIVFDTIVLLLSGTRGTILGLVGGALLALLIVAVFQGSKRLRIVALASIVAVVLAGAGIKLGKDTALVKNVGFLDRLSQIELNAGTIGSRFLNMGMAIQGVKERPLLGWGQENYAIVFDKYYDPRMYAQEPWFDRVHNIIFDWLVTGGILGLLAYLSIFVATLYVIWRRHVLAVPERAILTGLLAGYFMHNMAVFDNITSYLLFATVLGYIVWRERDAKKNAPLFSADVFPKGSAPFVAAIAGIITFAGVWWTNIPAMQANWTLLQAMARRDGGITDNLATFKKALGYGALGTQEIREQLAQASIQVASQNFNFEIKKQFLDLADSQMKLQEAASPLDARFPLFRGVVLSAYGDLKGAEAALLRARELSPGKQSILYELARNAAAQGKSDAVLAYFKEAFEAEESNSQARFLYAAALIKAGDDAAADAVLAPKIENGEAANKDIAAAYYARGRFDKIVEIWKAHVKASPQDKQGYYTLAAAYYSMGDNANAIATLEQGIAAIPEIESEIRGLIQEIRAGTAKLQ